MNFSKKNHEHRSTIKMIVSKKRFTIIMLLISGLLIAQNGINYKALIKDSNGNVITNQGIDMVFSIQFEGNTLYSELQQIVTDNNGIAIATIGVGSTITGVFDTITWKLGSLELNVKIDFGDGLVDFGNIPFNTVPYAIETINKEGLIAVNEGSGSGWRLEGVIVDGEEGYGAIGNNATDLSVTDTNGASLFYPYGATGISSFSTGTYTIAYGDYSTALGYATIASENYSTALGRSTQASAIYSTAMGRSTDAESYNSTAIGRYNVGGGNSITWVENDPLFEIGNGSSNSNKNNALTIYKSGLHSINSSSSGLSIDAEGNGINIPNSGNDGISITSPGDNGIVIFGAVNDGITISADDDGIVISADDSGARIHGDNVGVYASGGQLQSDVPDIILGSASNTLFSDDGIISTNPLRTGSDMFLRSYDAVVVHLDYDNNEAGNFRIRNGTEDIVFDVSESGNVSVNGSVVHSSDKRLKTSIEDLSYGLNEVLQLQPKQYFWKNQSQQKKSLGLIAQEVQPIISEIVNIQDNEAKTLGISYTELIPVLINAIKEQNKIIESQGDALKTSKNNYEALLSRIEILESKSSN